MDKLLYAIFGRYLGKTVVLSSGGIETQMGKLTDVYLDVEGRDPEPDLIIELDGKRLDGWWYIEGAAK